MCVAPSKKCAQYIGLAKEHFNFSFPPVLRRYLLHKLEEFVKVHPLQLAAELAQEGGTDVHVKVFKAVAALFADVGIPQSDDAFHVEFTQQQAIHPLERKLHELDPYRLDVIREVPVDAIDELLQPHDHPLDAGLISRVMVLDSRQDVGQAPVDVGFDLKGRMGASGNQKSERMRGGKRWDGTNQNNGMQGQARPGQAIQRQQHTHARQPTAFLPTSSTRSSARTTMTLPSRTSSPSYRSARKTAKRGVARSLIPCTYDEAG